LIINIKGGCQFTITTTTCKYATMVVAMDMQAIKGKVVAKGQTP
jgi:hypothetical protein